MLQQKQKQREFHFSEKDFLFLSDLVGSHTGIVLNKNKFELVYSRLARRIRKLQLNSFKDYIVLLQGDDADIELSFLVDAITTNLTKFFRESHQLKDFVLSILKEAEEKVRKGGEKKLRIWSAACSSGQEPYSIAMVIASYLKNYKDWDILILATDIDRNMLQKGREGVYTIEEAQSIPEKFLKKHMCETADSEWVVRPAIQNLIRFKHLNLLHDWPMNNEFDTIFCRNVIIYFDTDTKESLVDRLCQKIKPEGMLFLGHSESLINKHPALKPHGKAAFRKVDL